jgi:predicted transposase YbfD/YdcC
VEWRVVSGAEATDPQKTGFPSARQIVGLNRRVLGGAGQMSNETVHLISSLEPQKASGDDLKKIKRAYWRIESDLHSRLDQILDEDRSRVRTPKAAHVLGMFRRLAVSFAIAWTTERQKKRKRTSTRDFLDHLRMHNARHAFHLVTAKSPLSWMTGK